jgi:hypothetical protein
MAKKTKLSSMVAAPVATSPSYKVSAEDKERERRYRAEDALRDIERAEAHKADKSLMKDVKCLAKEKIDNMKKIC